MVYRSGWGNRAYAKLTAVVMRFHLAVVGVLLGLLFVFPTPSIAAPQCFFDDGCGIWAEGLAWQGHREQAVEFWRQVEDQLRNGLLFSAITRGAIPAPKGKLTSSSMVETKSAVEELSTVYARLGSLENAYRIFAEFRELQPSFREFVEEEARELTRRGRADLAAKRIATLYDQEHAQQFLINLALDTAAKGDRTGASVLARHVADRDTRVTLANDIRKGRVFARVKSYLPFNFGVGRKSVAPIFAFLRDNDRNKAEGYFDALVSEVQGIDLLGGDAVVRAKFILTLALSEAARPLGRRQTANRLIDDALNLFRSREDLGQLEYRLVGALLNAGRINDLLVHLKESGGSAGINVVRALYVSGRNAEARAALKKLKKPEFGAFWPPIDVLVHDQGEGAARREMAVRADCVPCQVDILIGISAALADQGDVDGASRVLLEASDLDLAQERPRRHMEIVDYAVRRGLGGLVPILLNRLNSAAREATNGNQRAAILQQLAYGQALSRNVAAAFATIEQIANPDWQRTATSLSSAGGVIHRLLRTPRLLFLQD